MGTVKIQLQLRLEKGFCPSLNIATHSHNNLLIFEDMYKGKEMKSPGTLV
jgi:hypothetical protein